MRKRRRNWLTGDGKHFYGLEHTLR